MKRDLFEIRDEFLSSKHKFQEDTKDSMYNILDKVGFLNMDVKSRRSGKVGQIKVIFNGSFYTPFEYKFYHYTKAGKLSKNSSDYVSLVCCNSESDVTDELQKTFELA